MLEPIFKLTLPILGVFDEIVPWDPLFAADGKMNHEPIHGCGGGKSASRSCRRDPCPPRSLKPCPPLTSARARRRIQHALMYVVFMLSGLADLLTVWCVRGRGQIFCASSSSSFVAHQLSTCVPLIRAHHSCAAAGSRTSRPAWTTFSLAWAASARCGWATSVMKSKRYRGCSQLSLRPSAAPAELPAASLPSCPPHSRDARRPVCAAIGAS